MTTTAWIIIIVVVLIAAALVAWLMTQQRKNKQHEHAEHLRQEAHEHAAVIPQVQDNAKEAEAKAEVARLEAERAAREAQEAQVAATQQEAVHEDRLRTADEVDPRVDTTSDDYDTGTGTAQHETVRESDAVHTDDPDRTTDDTHRA
jgi:predicted negative regulator of RcsB-dependent stress response